MSSFVTFCHLLFRYSLACFASHSPISPPFFPNFFRRFFFFALPQFILLKIFNIFVWNVTPCNLVDIYCRFLVERCLRLQGGIWRKCHLPEASVSFYQTRRRHVVFIAVRMSYIAISVTPRVIRCTKFDRLTFDHNISLQHCCTFVQVPKTNTASVRCMKTVRGKCSFVEQTDRHITMRNVTGVTGPGH